MIPTSALAAVLASQPTIDLTGVFFRAVKLEYLQGPPPGAAPGSSSQALWPGGARANGARYTPVGGPDCLYLATNGATALAEVDALLFDPVSGVPSGVSHDPLVVVSARGQLPHLLDLCDHAVQVALGTSEKELTAGWARAQERHRLGRGPLPPTQALGIAAFATTTLLGLRYPSRKHKSLQNLVVFTDRLKALGGHLTLVDSSGILRQTLP